jgi:hypothetical protein
LNLIFKRHISDDRLRRSADVASTFASHKPAMIGWACIVLNSIACILSQRRLYPFLS